MSLALIGVAPNLHCISPKYRWKGKNDVARPTIEAVSPTLLVLYIISTPHNTKQLTCDWN